MDKPKLKELINETSIDECDSIISDKIIQNSKTITSDYNHPKTKCIPNQK